MTDTVRVVATAAALSAIALAMLAWRISRSDASGPDRLIGELRLAQWAACLLAAVGAVSIGLALANPSLALAHVDATLGVLCIGAAGVVLQRDPREALLLLAIAFGMHALVDIAHRPGWLSPDVAPRWFTIGGATFDVYVAAICFWARRQ